MNKVFDGITNFINGLEDSFINFISAVILLMVPGVPAYLTYHHSIIDLGFPNGVAWLTALVVEFLGIASVRTSIKFYAHNQRYKKTEVKRAPFRTVVLTYVFYIVVVLSVNVLLDIGKMEARQIWAIALFSLLSVPAGYLMAARAQHTELLREIEDDKAKAAATRAQNKQKQDRQQSKVYASSKRQEIIDLLTVIYETEGRIAGPTEICARLELDADTSKGYISERTKEWKVSHPDAH